jgi:hypothetical protein
MISLPTFLTSLWMTSRVNGSPLRMAAPTPTQGCIMFTLKKWGIELTSGFARPAGLGQLAQAHFEPVWSPSHTWVLLPFCTLPPSIISFWWHHPRVQDRGSSRMKSGLLHFNLRGCFFVKLRSLPPLGLISSCT